MTKLERKTWLPYPVIRQVPIECGGRAVFELCQNFSLDILLGKDLRIDFCKRAGFLTDFGSIPWFLFRLFNPLDMHLSVSFLVHDDLYSVESKCPRSQADGMQQVIADVYGAPRKKEIHVYTALRLFGGWFYPSKGIEDRRPKVVAAVRSGPYED